MADRRKSAAAGAGLPWELWAGLILGALFLLAIAFGGALQTHDPFAGNLDARFLGVGEKGHLLGTDNLGRDLFSRVIEGLSWSLAAATIATLIACAVGTVLGLVAAQWHGWPRAGINQFVDAALSFPGLMIAIIVVAVVGKGFWPLAITLGALSWPVFARVVYAEARALLVQDYVVAARVLGTGPVAILAGHVLPGLRPTMAVMLAFHFADMLVAESALSFLGLGAPIGVPTWGNLLQESRDFLIVAPWLMAVPAIAIVLLVITANLIGDGLTNRDRGRGRRIEV